MSELQCSTWFSRDFFWVCFFMRVSDFEGPVYCSDLINAE